MLKVIIMYSKITSEIKVTVLPEYDAKNSFPSDNRFVFRYNVTIENLSTHPVQILKRQWLIYDVGFGFTEVNGDGVIGLTPEIAVGEEFKYFSNVMIRSGVGNMTGKYFCINTETGEPIEIEIPKFNLMAQVLSN